LACSPVSPAAAATCLVSSVLQRLVTREHLRQPAVALRSSRQDAADDWAQRPQYFDVTVWSGLGDWIGRNLVQGDKFIVAGRLRWHEWTNDQGDKAGRRHHRRQRHPRPALRRRRRARGRRGPRGQEGAGQARGQAQAEGDQGGRRGRRREDIPF
jgi:single-stranded DNA-binding protein